MSLTRRSRLIATAAVLSLTAIPAPVAAQTGYVANAEIANCLASQQRALAAQFVLDRSTLEIKPAFAPLLSACPGAGGLATSPQAMRFALAEALLRNEIGSIDAAALPNARPLPLPRLVASNYEPETGKLYAASQVVALENRRLEDEAALVQYRFGDCVVRTNPQVARAFLQAAPDSNAESQALQSAMPALSNCVQQGVQFKLDKPSLRGALAFAYYSLAHAPAASR